LYYEDQFLNNRLEEMDRKALEQYEKAIGIDPNFALAYAHSTFCYGTLGRNFGFPDLIPKAKAAAMKAIQLDESLAEAHGALAYVLFTFDWDWAGTEREYKRAIELNPS